MGDHIAAATDEIAGRIPPSRYRAPIWPRAISVILIGVIHAAAFVAFLSVGPTIVQSVPEVPLTVTLLPLDPLPNEPRPVTLPVRREVTPQPRPARVVAPLPIVRSPPLPPLVETTPQAAPLAPVPVRAEVPRPTAPRARETMANLNTRLLSAEPPRYPVESRRKRETGTVVLLVVVDEQGRVSSISIATSSGFDRLDQAALGAVRRWRWSPLIIDGRPSRVKGLVRIPFELRNTV